MANEQSNEQQSQLIEVSGLWKNTDKTGASYLSGNWGAVKLFVFPNKNKKTDKEPLYRLYISQAVRKNKDENNLIDNPPMTYEQDDIQEMDLG